MDENSRKEELTPETEEEEIPLEDEPTPRRFYLKWGLFFGILIVLMIVCLVVISVF